MGDSAATDNVTVNRVNGVINALVNGAEELAKRLLVAEAPWLRLPIISTMFNYLLKRITDAFYVYVAENTAYAIIDAQTEKQLSDFMKRFKEWEAVQAAGKTDAEELKKLKEAAARLVRWDGHGTIRKL